MGKAHCMRIPRQNKWVPGWQGLSDSRRQVLGQIRQAEGGKLETERESVMQNRNEHRRLDGSVNSSRLMRWVGRLWDAALGWSNCPQRGGTTVGMAVRALQAWKWVHHGRSFLNKYTPVQAYHMCPEEAGWNLQLNISEGWDSKPGVADTTVSQQTSGGRWLKTLHAYASKFFSNHLLYLINEVQSQNS